MSPLAPWRETGLFSTAHAVSSVYLPAYATSAFSSLASAAKVTSCTCFPLCFVLFRSVILGCTTFDLI